MENSVNLGNYCSQCLCHVCECWRKEMRIKTKIELFKDQTIQDFIFFYNSTSKLHFNDKLDNLLNEYKAAIFKKDLDGFEEFNSRD